MKKKSMRLATQASLEVSCTTSLDVPKADFNVRGRAPRPRHLRAHLLRSHPASTRLTSSMCFTTCIIGHCGVLDARSRTCLCMRMFMRECLCMRMCLCSCLSKESYMHSCIDLVHPLCVGPKAYHSTFYDD